MDNFAEKSQQELAQELVVAHKSLFELNMKKSSGQLERSHVIVDLKKRIARIKTFLRQKTCKVNEKKEE